jgi:hypothetical protein
MTLPIKLGPEFDNYFWYFHKDFYEFAEVYWDLIQDSEGWTGNWRSWARWIDTLVRQDKDEYLLIIREWKSPGHIGFRKTLRAAWTQWAQYGTHEVWISAIKPYTEKMNLR